MTKLRQTVLILLAILSWCTLAFFIAWTSQHARSSEVPDPAIHPPTTLTCHGPVANVTIYDYAGPFIAQFCVYTFQYTGAALTVTGGDPAADGIFHNGFE